MKKHLNISVRGRVQGVWFRQGTLEKAAELGLTGTAQNMPDGSVQIEAEGDKDKLKQLVEWCHQGPELADVKSVEHYSDELQGYSDFRIR